jgi:plasmid replication initiation protein
MKNTKNLLVYKANEVVEASYKLSLNEQRVILACIAQVNSTNALLATDRFELSSKDFSKIFAVADNTAYEALRDVTETLFNRYVVIANPFPEHPTAQYLKTRWISSILYFPDEGKISLRFAQDMLPYLSELKHTFTKYKLEHIGKMTSIYAIRLYELLMQWRGMDTGKREIELDWLKTQFDISDQYQNMNDFKKRALDPAVKDINEHSNLTVSWTQRKAGRRVTHLTFTFGEKDKPAAKPQEKRILGVSKSEVEKLAKAGESWEAAAGRIKAGKTKKVA